MSEPRKQRLGEERGGGGAHSNPSMQARERDRTGWYSRRLVLFMLPLLGAAACKEAADDNPAEGTERALTAGGTSSTESAQPGGHPDAAVAAVVASGADAAPAKQTVWVVMKDKAQLAQAKAAKDWKTRGAAVRSALTNTALQSQAALHLQLAQKGVKHQSFWIVNTMKVEADQATIDEIAKRTDVARVVQDQKYSVPPRQSPRTTPRPQDVEWGLASIHAPEVWSALGARGDGIVVANIDTGVDFSHPALVQQYRGRQVDGSFDHNYNWYDPAMVCGSPSTEPCDNVGHGTHTMGTMVGDDGGDNQIGVAPGARWIAAKGCEDMWCSTDSLLAAAQWILAPTDLGGQNPRDDLRPHVVNNSWGGGSGDPFFAEAVEAWVDAGIFPAFSIGNSGDYCGSASSPGDYDMSYAAGAYDEFGAIAWFSSRGPTYPDGRIKPNLAAPGVNVRSSVPGAGYDWYSGTSMASPHLSGTVALMWSAAPPLIGDIAATRTILDESAVDTEDLTCGGDPGNNNVWGQGQLDALAAVELSPVGPTGILQGTVTNVADGQPVPGVTLLVQGGTHDRVVRVAPDGTYQTRLGTGTYTVTAKAFGFLDLAAADVSISEGATTVQDFQLTQAPSFALSGIVRTAAGAPMAGAQVTILGTPLPGATTDGNGQYAFAAVPQGQYDVRAEGSACYDAQSLPLAIDADATLDFALPQRVDSYGYTCVPTTYGYVEANTVLPIDYASYAADITLPFPFTFYGQTYEMASVTALGYLSFLRSPYLQWYNVPIPDPTDPNAAVYPFWDDLYPADDSSVRTELLGTAPHRQFVVEWRNLYSYDTGLPISFEVVLYEDSHILMQYPSGDDLWQQGLMATVGLENENGTVAFQYSYNKARLAPQTAVLYSLPPSGIVQGTVVDANDGIPATGATVQAVDGSGTVIRSTTTTPSGFYRLLVPAGTYTIVASKKNYDTAQATVSVALEQTVEQSFALKTGVASLSPSNLQLLMPIGQKRVRTLVLSNTGSTPLTFTLAESGGRKLAVAPTRTLKRTQGFSANSPTTRGLFSGGAQTAGIGIDAAGDVLKTFVLPGMQAPWGVGFTGNLWFSDYYTYSDTEFTVDGAPTGRQWPTKWASGWPADMAYDESRGLICQLDVGGDNGIHCWNADTGAEVDKITGSFPWTQWSQRGLAYRTDDDTFYVGGWNDGTIYHVKGLAAPDKGAVLGSCMPADGAISGLTYNTAAGVLWMATNSYTDTIYQLNPDDCTVLSVLNHPTPGWAGAGLEMDLEGNLWMIDQNQRSAMLMDSGVPAFSDVPWLVPTPPQGAVAPGESAQISVEVNTTGMSAGLYLATLYVQTTAAKQPTLRVPVSLVVSAYQQGVVAGGNAYSDSLGDPWAADRAYKTGSWGYVQKSKTASTSKTIGGTVDQRLFKTQRINPYAYRFDNVPNGIYQIDLNFAELTNVKIGRRLYDVIIENTLVLPAHDIVYEVGALKADKHVFFVEVADGQMDVRLIPRAGFELPVINSLRVTHRPDR